MTGQADVLDLSGTETSGMAGNLMQFCFFVLIGIASTGNSENIPQVGPWLQSHYIGPLQYTEFFQVLATLFVCINLAKWLISAVNFVKQCLKKRKSKMLNINKLNQMGGNPGGGPGDGGGSSSGGSSSSSGSGGDKETKDDN